MEERDEQEEIQRVRFPQGDEVLGIVEAQLGASKLRVHCADEKIRICRIPGRLRKRIWMEEGDVVLVKPWTIHGDKNGDVIWKYTPAQAGWLRRRGILTL
jgi:translation initiation factor 1A